MEDTIVALSTATSAGAIAIIRISGAGSLGIMQKIFSAHHKLRHSMMVHGKITSNGTILDDVMAVYYASPSSYTGEDAVEIFCHASEYGVYDILNCISENGARMAQPGEFTKRAFLNGKMDLTQAEAVCDFISASSSAGARAAQSQLQGEMKRFINGFQDRLGDMLAEIEAAVEYPEEDLEFTIIQKAIPFLQKLNEEINALAKTYETGRVIKEGFTVAIAGKPNVGKSSLLNVLCGVERAIVTEMAGTTRDTIGETISINGVAVHLIDTAGIRDTSDTIEALGVQRSVEAARRAHLTLFVLDGSLPIDGDDSRAFSSLDGEVLVVVNKTDANAAITQSDLYNTLDCSSAIWVSALTGEGMDELKSTLFRSVIADKTSAEGVLVTNSRHRGLLLDASSHIGDAIAALRAGIDMDCVTIDLSCAWADLGGITGNTVTEDIIDKIFDKFCLGK